MDKRVIIIAAVALVIVFSVGFAVNRAFDADRSFPMTGNNLSDIQAEQNISANTAIEQLTNSTVAGFNMDIAEIVERNLDINRTLALSEVRRLAAKGDDLLFEDFSSYGGANVSSNLNYNIMVYSVQGGYRLVVDSKPSGKPDSVALESIWESGESGIDIRYNDVDAFIQANPSRPSLSAREALVILNSAQEFAGATFESVSWEILGNEPVPRSPQAIFARNLLGSLDALVEDIVEPCWLFHCVSLVPTNEQYLAVGKKTGVVYSGSADTGGKVKNWIWQEISPEHPGFYEPEIPADYSLENAKADGLVVYEDINNERKDQILKKDTVCTPQRQRKNMATN